MGIDAGTDYLLAEELRGIICMDDTQAWQHCAEATSDRRADRHECSEEVQPPAILRLHTHRSFRGSQ